MRINSLKLSKIFSFGPEQSLEGFSDYNLLIGPNGTGKTNILRVLNGLDFDINKINGKVRTSNQTHTAGTQITESDVFTPAFDIISNTAGNRDAHTSSIRGVLEIKYEEITSSTQISADKKEILFQDNPDGHMSYCGGDTYAYAHRVNHITVPETDAEFFRDVALYLGGQAVQYRSVLNFGLYYVFRLHYEFLKDGQFVQGKLSGGGTVENDFQNLPSGVSQFAKCFTRILMSQNKSVLLIDEPELHLEARLVRRFFEFLIWYCVRSKQSCSAEEKVIYDQVEAILNENTQDDETRFGKIPDKFGDTLQGKQIFIASHSSVLINEFLNLKDASRVYEVSLTEEEFKHENKVFPDSNNGQLRRELFTSVRLIKSIPHSIVESLGCRGADLLQCNGVVWVEGPSDIIFMEKWLNMYAAENNLPIFERGKHYEFQMYGGTLLDSLCLIKDGQPEIDEQRKLVEMFSFSRNAYVVTDSDAITKDDGSIVDSSKFFAAKKFIRAEIQRLNIDGYKLGMWYAENNTVLRTIEDYLDDESLTSKTPSSSKKIKARKIVAAWGNEKKLDDFPLSLNIEIMKMFKVIQSWQW